MAKKKLFNKKQKIDWRFVALLIGILLVGLSVFALNQRLTYKSSAQWAPPTPQQLCAQEERQCMSGCKWERVCQPIAGGDCKWLKISPQSCKQSCADQADACRERAEQGQQNQNAPQGTGQVFKNRDSQQCQNFVLSTCINGCNYNLPCLQQCLNTQQQCNSNAPAANAPGGGAPAQ